MLAKRPRYFKYKRPYNKKSSKNICATQASSTLLFGSLGIRLLEACKLKYHQVEAARRTLIRPCKFKSKIWFRVSFDIQLTGKPQEARMGKGKGKLKHCVSLIPAGSVFLELDNILVDWAFLSILIKTMSKMPVKTVLCFRW